MNDFQHTKYLKLKFRKHPKTPFDIKRLVKMSQNLTNSMKAKFNGKCVECGESIKVGKEILKNSQDKWVHKACSDLEEELP